ncbi:MAG: hypothetical protein AAB618_03605 [Patescibacteria group bacterium]
MYRASNAFSILQATAAIAGIAILLWSIGFPAFHFAEAAGVTTYSDTLSDSAPSVDANHTIVFTTPTGVANGSTIVITFAAAFTPTSVDFTDIDVATTSGEFTLATDCTGSERASAAFSGDVLTITMCSGDGGLIAANGTTTIEIGTHATSQTTGDQQINNPPATGSYEIPLTAGASDTGQTEIAIVDTVLVSASVDTVFTFTVAGLPGGTTVNTADTTGGTTTATTIPFGELNAGVASTAAQDLTVVTNAKNGFVVTVVTDQQLLSGNGADIDGFSNGAFTSSPTAWANPSATPGSEETYGHWGLTSDDSTLTQALTNPYNVGAGGNRFVSASTSPVEVFRHNGPTDGTGNGEGIATVGYKVETSALQEAATDYQATLTYVATPVF